MIQITAEMAGILLPEDHGWRNEYHVVYLAMGYGWRPGPDTQAIILAYIKAVESDDVDPVIKTLDGTVYVYDAMADLSDSAVDYLNAHAPSGYVFDWDGCALVLYPLEGW